MAAILGSLHLVRTAIVAILIPLAIVFLITAAGFYFFSLTQPSSVQIADDYGVLKDTLTIVLTVVALAVAAFGAGAYIILRNILSQAVASQVEVAHSGPPRQPFR